MKIWNWVVGRAKNERSRFEDLGMAEKRIFVGRKDELEKFRKVLEDPKGQAVLVVGHAGMGDAKLRKTFGRSLIC
jgi:hypothetical protein